MKSRLTFAALLAGTALAMGSIPVSGAHAGSGSSRVALTNTVGRFGRTGTYGSVWALNAYAAPQLLRRLPHHSLAEAMHLRSSAQSFASHIESMDGASATVTTRWTYGGSKNIVDRLTWTKMSGAWRVSSVRYLGQPTLRLRCELPNGNNVSCQLSGRGFAPHERIAITYHVTYLALPKINGSYQEKVWSRVGVTDAGGTFVRPMLAFSVVTYHESYRFTATVEGLQGDAAVTTVEAVAQ
jgi:hypothetical protein